MGLEILQSFPNIGNQLIWVLFSHLDNGRVICPLCLASFVLFDRAVCQHDVFLIGNQLHQLREAFSLLAGLIEFVKAVLGVIIFVVT